MNIHANESAWAHALLKFLYIWCLHTNLSECEYKTPATATISTANNQLIQFTIHNPSPKRRSIFNRSVVVVVVAFFCTLAIHTSKTQDVEDENNNNHNNREANLCTSTALFMEFKRMIDFRSPYAGHTLQLNYIWYLLPPMSHNDDTLTLMPLFTSVFCYCCRRSSANWNLSLSKSYMLDCTKNNTLLHSQQRPRFHSLEPFLLWLRYCNRILK